MFEKMVNGIMEKAAENIKTEQGDYVKDGLLHCGKCNTPKQCRIELFGSVKTPMCLCKCETEKREQEEAERKRIELQRRIKDYRRLGFPESEMQSWTFENADGSNEKIMTAAQNYVANFDSFKEQGKGLLFFGECGVGKTYFAACIANALIDKGVPVLMTNFARITNTVQGMFDGKQEYYDSLNKYPLLILDDLAAERKTEYMQEAVFSVIDSRYRIGLPMIITTNLTSQELKNPADISYQRIYDRVLERCHPIKVEGGSKRKEILKRGFGDMQKLLGLE